MAKSNILQSLKFCALNVDTFNIQFNFLLYARINVNWFSASIAK